MFNTGTNILGPQWIGFRASEQASGPPPTPAIELVQFKSVYFNSHDQTFDLDNLPNGFILAFLLGLSDSPPPICMDTNGNLYTPFIETVASGQKLIGFYAFNTVAGPNTVSAFGSNDFTTVSIMEYKNVQHTADPFIDAGTTDGNASPLGNTINTEADGLAVGMWASEFVLDYLSVNSGGTEVFVNADAYCAFMHNLNTILGMTNISVNTGGAAENLFVCGSFKKQL